MKILISGGYGCHNLGDDAQLLNNCEYFKSCNYTDVKIISPRTYLERFCGYSVVLGFQKDFVKNSSDVLLKRFYEIIEEKNLTKIGKTLINEIKSCDVLFVSGSGTFNTRNHFGMLRALLPVAIAVKYNKRVILSGQGFSPMENEELEQILSSYLNKCEAIFIRDFNTGKRILQRIGVKNDLIHIGVDDAFTLKETNYPKIHPKSVAINISCYGDEKLYTILIDFADYLFDNGYYPIFNYFHYKDKEVFDKYLKGKYPIIGFDPLHNDNCEFKSPKDAKGFFKQCVAVVGMRYHSSILSFGIKTPVINIAVNKYQKQKFTSINENQTIIPCLVSQYLTLEELIEKFKLILINDTTKIHEKWLLNSQLACKYINSNKNPILDIIKSRRSIRVFTDQKIKNSDLIDLVEAGIYAPSGSNTQCYRFKIVTDKNDISFLADKKIKIVNNANAIILVMADYDKCPYLQSKRIDVFKDLPIQDCAMAMQNICLLAESKQISQCVIQLSESWPTSAEIKEYFHIADNYKLQGMILLGYANETVDYENDTHANRKIKRNKIEEYLL